jgi:hypothetical protein
MNRFFFALSLLCLVATLGCPAANNLPATVTAEGVVTLDGQPVENATVVCISETTTYSAAGVTDKNGKFSLKSFEEKPGAVPGDYRIEITKTVVEGKGEKSGEAVVNIQHGLPKKYSTFSTSGLSLTIPDKGDSNIKFDLKK